MKLTNGFRDEDNNTRAPTDFSPHRSYGLLVCGVLLEELPPPLPIFPQIGVGVSSSGPSHFDDL